MSRPYCPDKVNLVEETCLSHQTIGSTIDDLGDNIEGTLKDKLSACVLYSLVSGEVLIKVKLHN